MRALLSLAALCSCDAVYGLDISRPAPCPTPSFDGMKTTDIATAEAFSLSWDRDRIVFVHDGALYDQTLPSGTPQRIDVGDFIPVTVALAPEGDAMFYSIALEPPELHAQVKLSTGWTVDDVVPVGTYAGTPSADEFGPRRVVVRLTTESNMVQEYVAADNAWFTADVPHPLEGVFAANLSPDALELTYLGVDGDGAPAVMLAHRATTDVWFDPPTPILHGTHYAPQLLDRCRQLYVVDSTPGETSTNSVRRYSAL